VQPGGHEDQDVSPGDARPDDRLDERREQRAVWHGRVMSQMRMQALFRPRAISESGGDPTGFSSASFTARDGSRTGSIGCLPIIVTRRSSGSRTVRVFRPYKSRRSWVDPLPLHLPESYSNSLTASMAAPIEQSVSLSMMMSIT